MAAFSSLGPTKTAACMLSVHDAESDGDITAFIESELYRDPKLEAWCQITFI